jgi:hypothetical protein
MGKRGPGARPTGKQPDTIDCVRRSENHRTPRAAAVIAFIEGLKLTSGAHAGQPFKLRPWQEGIIRGIYRPGVKTALVTLPRGQGKNAIVRSDHAGGVGLRRPARRAIQRRV